MPAPLHPPARRLLGSPSGGPPFRSRRNLRSSPPIHHVADCCRECPFRPDACGLARRPPCPVCSNSVDYLTLDVAPTDRRWRASRRPGWGTDCPCTPMRVIQKRGPTPVPRDRPQTPSSNSYAASSSTTGKASTGPFAASASGASTTDTGSSSADGTSSLSSPARVVRGPPATSWVKQDAPMPGSCGKAAVWSFPRKVDLGGVAGRKGPSHPPCVFVPLRELRGENRCFDL